MEENNYYPFGLKHKGYNNVVNSTNPALKKKFAGEEFEDELGKNTVAFQWRDYDPAIGRFNKIDRFAEKYADVSPYGFTKNNPILFREFAGDSTRVYVFDEANRPQDNGTSGTTYTADVYVYDDETGKLNGPYEGSSYPNSKSNTDNSTSSNTVNTGEHDYNNTSGHKGGDEKGFEPC